MKNIAFSLVELLVVIVILTVITAIAIPSYNEYRTKAELIKVYNQILPLFRTIQKEYLATGNVPTSITLGGVSVPNTGSPTIVDYESIYYVLYQTTYSPNASFRIDVSISGLEGIPGYTDPETAGWGNTASILRFVMREEDNGTFTTVCGKYGGYNAQELPSTYVPSQCNCTTLGTYFFFGLDDC